MVGGTNDDSHQEQQQQQRATVPQHQESKQKANVVGHVEGMPTVYNINDNNNNDDGDDHQLQSKQAEPQSSRNELSYFVIKITIIASIGGCLFGYDMGAISSALPQLIQTFDLTEGQAEYIVSILFVGGGIGAACGGSICDIIGRQKSILLTDIIFIIGATILYFARSATVVVVGRFIVGFGIAVSGIADVSYLHEIAPIQYRGAIVSVNEACISLGFLLAYLAGYVYSGESDTEEWRIIFGWAGILALIQLVGMWNMPESPQWLLQQQGRYDDYVNAYKQIHGENTIVPTNEGDVAVARSSASGGDSSNMISSRNSENDGIHWSPKYKSVNPATINLSGQQQMILKLDNGDDDDDYDADIGRKKQHLQQQPLDNTNATSSVRAILNDTYQFVISLFATYRKQSYIALYLSVVQQFCGQTSVLNYAPIIFAESINNSGNNVDNGDGGGDDVSGAPKWSTVAIGLVKFAVTVIVIARIENIGRRRLLLIGQAIIALGLLCLIVAFGGFTAIPVDEDDVADDNVDGKDNSTGYQIDDLGFELALPGVLMVVSGYSMSFGPLTWLLTSELYPTHIRGRALGVSTIITYLCASVVTRTFLSAQSILGPSKVFAFYFVITVMGITFSYLGVPDTGGKTVDQVDSSLRNMPWWRFEHIALGQVDIVDFDDRGGVGGSDTGVATGDAVHSSFNNGGTVARTASYTRHNTPPRSRRKSETRHLSGEMT